MQCCPDYMYRLLQVALYAVTICALMAATRGKAVLCDGARLSGADEHLPPFARPAHAHAEGQAVVRFVVLG